jgi:hypothetical protein
LFLLIVSASIRIHQAPAWQNHNREGSPEQQLKNRPGTNRPETTGLGQAQLDLLITRVILRVKGEIVFFFICALFADQASVPGNHHWTTRKA